MAYSGPGPHSNVSGIRLGRRRLSKKGPALLRRQMYLPGLAASHSKALGSLYRANPTNAFASNEAVVILGRTLLRVAFAF